LLPTAYEAPIDILIRKIADHLKSEVEEINPPSWTQFAKTSVHAKISPLDPDWWYVRCASILRKIYVNGPIGISRLRKAYGGRAEKGMTPGRFKRGGGSAVRKAIQQLEKAELVATSGNKGRIVTGKGQALVDGLSSGIVGKSKKRTKT